LTKHARQKLCPSGQPLVGSTITPKQSAHSHSSLFSSSQAESIQTLALDAPIGGSKLKRLFFFFSPKTVKIRKCRGRKGVSLGYVGRIKT
jgi:hypothetical protein